MSTQIVTSPQALMPAMNVSAALDRYHALVDFTKQIMKPDKDYGVVPGTDKPTLLKPGAEKLTSFFGLSPEFTIIEKVEDWTGDFHGGEALFSYMYRCSLTKDGVVHGTGEGSCNSWESKYRYRWVAEHDVPLGLDTMRLKHRDDNITEFEFAYKKRETGGKYGKPESYWQAFDEAIANGTVNQVNKEVKGRPAIAYQILGRKFRVPNPDIHDQINTIQKMAQKRALIAATLIACNASEFFTQDMEDLQPTDNPTPAAAPMPQPTTEPKTRTPRTTPNQDAEREAVKVRLEELLHGYEAIGRADQYDAIVESIGQPENLTQAKALAAALEKGLAELMAASQMPQPVQQG